MEDEEKKKVNEAVNDLHTWLHTEGINLPGDGGVTFVQKLCRKMRRQKDDDTSSKKATSDEDIAAIPLDRFHLGASILHPQIAAYALTWEYPDEVVNKYWRTRDDLSNIRETIGEDAPTVRLMDGAPFVRIKSTDKNIPKDCDWFVEGNYTDLYCLPAAGCPQDDASVIANAPANFQGGFSFATRAPGGFSDAHISILNGTLLSLSTVTRFYRLKYTSKTLLMTYLGEDAGGRVYSGDILRGNSVSARACIWFSDIRNFTHTSAEIWGGSKDGAAQGSRRQHVLDLINGVFEITYEVVRKHKGQILKYMGDGCMAVFIARSDSCSHTDDEGTGFRRESITADQRRQHDDSHGHTLCHRARLAAAEVQERLAALKTEREASGLHGASVGIGLHYGDISYGNVGAPERLDFTVIGPSVNLASRIESSCSKLGAKVLASEDFVKLEGDHEAWTSRGEYPLKGVKHPVGLFELKETASPS